MEIGKPNDMKTSMPFGKHKGTEVADLPDKYLRWLIEQDWFETDHGFLFKAVNDELTTRLEGDPDYDSLFDLGFEEDDDIPF